ncbi:MAG: DUF3395 domain-containing protein [Candidatus Acidiferrales bacterium]
MRIARLVIPLTACMLFAALVVTPMIAPPPVHAQNGPLQINKAVYGKSGAGRDVTVRLRRMVTNGTLSVKVTNDNMGGDPNKGADKTLKVDYTYRGRRQSTVVKEGDRLKLP